MYELVKSLEEIQNPQQDQIVILETDGKAYKYCDDWQETTLEGGLTLNAYELNKQIISQLPTLDVDTLNLKKNELHAFCHTVSDNYFMLLSREINYYTVFHLSGTYKEKIEEVIIECCKNLGEIKAIDMTEDCGSFEIWIDHPIHGVIVAYFFPYDAGVELCR